MSGRGARRALGVVLALIVAGALNMALFATLAMLNRFELPEVRPESVVRLRNLEEPELEPLPPVEAEPAPVEPEPVTDEFLPAVPDLSPPAAAVLDLPMPEFAFSIPAIRVSNAGAVVGADPSIRTPVVPPKNNGQQGAREHVVRRATEIDDPPRALDHRKPAYPMSAHRRGIEGSVTVKILVNENGKVERIEVLEVVGYQGFRRSVLAVASAWRFTPPRHKGRRVRAYVIKKTEFKLEK